MPAGVVIVGAGAAGIGAGLELKGRGIPFTILEAAQRVGGRAHTDRASLPGYWDRGCQWLHCADVNPLVPWADRLGTLYDRSHDRTRRAYWRHGLRLSEAESAGIDARTDAGFDAVYAAGAAGEPTIAEALAAGGHDDPFLLYLMRLMACDEPERASARGYAAYADTGVDWIVRTGYGALIERMAEGLAPRTGVTVTGIEDRPGGVRVATAQGTIEARAAIVTVSTNVLLSGAIALPAGEARDLVGLMADVPCGAYEKVALALRHLPDGLSEMDGIAVDTGEPAKAPYVQIVPGAAPKMILHMAGALARGLSAEGAGAMTDFALTVLASAFGAHFRGLVTASAVTGWGGDPLVRGGYSYSAAGRAESRDRMIAADTGRIAFAGEAFSPRWQATAHGAYQSGRDVAARVAAGLAA